MKEKIFMPISIVLVFLLLSCFIPMPHGGTLGGNITESIKYEFTSYFSHEAKSARKREKEEWLLQKEKAKDSWRKFEQENPQYFPNE